MALTCLPTCLGHPSAQRPRQQLQELDARNNLLRFSRIATRRLQRCMVPAWMQRSYGPRASAWSSANIGAKRVATRGASRSSAHLDSATTIASVPFVASSTTRTTVYHLNLTAFGRAAEHA